MSIKKILSTLFAAILLIISPIDLNAASLNPGYEIMPCWEYMNGISIGLNFNGTNGYADISIVPIPNITTYVEATLCVYRRTGGDWSLVTSGSDSSSGALSIDLEFNAVYGQTYKAEATFTAYGEDGSETDTVSTQGNCPKAEDS